jgi:hypothetical protein
MIESTHENEYEGVKRYHCRQLAPGVFLLFVMNT